MGTLFAGKIHHNYSIDFDGILCAAGFRVYFLSAEPEGVKQSGLFCP